MIAQAVHMLPGLSLAPAASLGMLATTSRLLGHAVAAAHPYGAATTASPSWRQTAARWARHHATSTPATASATPSTATSSATATTASPATGQTLRPHEELHAPPTSLKAGAGSFAAGAVAPHPGLNPSRLADTLGMEPESHMPHPAYPSEYLETVRPTHTQPEKLYQHVGMRSIQVFRYCFDLATGYSTTGTMTEAQWLRRILFLETVAGVPGMVAGMARHLKSLRAMSRDRGWIHTLLEEAENERMHLLTFLQLRQPGPLFRAAVIGAQGVFFNCYFIAYLLSPRTCHAFVGFLEEEAVKTYTHALGEIDAGRLWKGVAAPPIAVQYWGLPQDATMRELILAVRADEACHAHVNHTLSKVASNDPNPFAGGASQLP